MSSDRQADPMAMANGPGAAAVLSAGIGCFALAVLACIADKSSDVKALMNIWKPTGPLSGVTTLAIVIWLVCWGVVGYLWRDRDVALARWCRIGFALLVLGVLLTFPPIADLL